MENIVLNVLKIQHIIKYQQNVSHAQKDSG